MDRFVLSNHMVRDEIEAAVKELNIDRNAFREVGKNRWQSIMKRTIEAFLDIPDHRYANLHWAWQYFRKPSISVPSLADGYRILPSIIDDDVVWFFAEDTFDKMWLYEVKSELLPQILGETSHFEYYIVSKKYEWILCENHHGCLIASGEKAVKNIMRLQSGQGQPHIF